MFDIQVDRIRAVVSFSLQDRVLVPEMERFVQELRVSLESLQGRDIKLLCDMRKFRPMAPEVADLIRKVHGYGLELGVKRVAEIIESDIVALQLNRVARESGTDKILRRFWNDESAQDWLLSGEPPVSSGSGSGRPSG